MLLKATKVQLSDDLPWRAVLHTDALRKYKGPQLKHKHTPQPARPQ